ncbi:MAG: hypothetical protein AAF236_13310 [Verrucomicrobiota bacterium]
MKYSLILAFLLPGLLRAEIPPDEAEAIAMFEAAGARVTRNEAGHAVKLFWSVEEGFSVADFQRIGELAKLTELRLNTPPAGDDEWDFLDDLPDLKVLTIWHAKAIRSLAPFSGLPIESLTVGGSMGLRDRNREMPEQFLDAVLTLDSLPNLTSANLYHSPLVCRDAHLEHLVTWFPNLVDVKIDVEAPRGFETEITPEGLAGLQALPVKVLSIENASSFSQAHVAAIAGIQTLEALLLDYRRRDFEAGPLVGEMKKLRPEVEVVVAEKGAKDPPRRAKIPK